MESPLEEIEDETRAGPVRNGATNERIQRHYTEAGPSYEFWSDRYNMHYGVWSRGKGPIRREPMLEAMNAAVVDRLPDRVLDGGSVVDAGCGLGATCRHLARHTADTTMVGVTNVPWQADAATALATERGFHDRISFLCADYRSVPLAEETVDGVFAIESSCYASGADKADLLEEFYRLIAPGGRFVLADVYRKHSRPLPRLARWCDAELRDCWAIPGFGEVDAVADAAIRVGFEDVAVEEISWRVAPSVAHTPFVTTSFLLRKLLGGSGINVEQRRLMKASLLSVLLGLFRRHFGYYLIGGRR